MVVDLSQVIELAAFAAGITAVMIGTGITYYEEKIPDCIGKVDLWLKDIENDLGKEISVWCETKKQEKGYEQILSVASKFSAVKSMNEQLDFMELRNTRQVKFHFITLSAIAVAVICFYYAGTQIANSTPYDEWISLGTGTALLATFLWAVGLYMFYTLYSDYSKLKRLVRQRVVEPVQES